MDRQNSKSRSRRLRRWLHNKCHRPDPSYSNEVSDSGDIEDESDDDLDDEFRSMENDACMLKNELRVFVGTWNVAGRSPVGSLVVDLDDWLNLKDAADIYVLGFQEIVPLRTRTVIGSEDPTEATKWNELIGKTLNNRCGSSWVTTPMLNLDSSDHYNYDGRRSVSVHGEQLGIQQEGPNGSSYKLMASKKMVGVFMSVWMKKELLRKYVVSNVKVCSVACGIMGYLGNKGSVSVSMSIEGTSFCFIAAHLASGEKKGDEGRRNHQVSEIFKRTYFPRLPGDDSKAHPLTILGHDRIFWFGDLNYRLYLEDNLARQLINKRDWRGLHEFDQLRREQETDGIFQGWKEGNIEFAPTYKYSTSNSNRYSGALPSRSGEKQRTPAWCDRIMWYGKGVKQLTYYRSESKFSDHRPVSALFSTQIEVKSTDPRIFPIITIPLAVTPDQTGKNKVEEEARSTLKSLIKKDVEESQSQAKIGAEMDLII